MKTNTWIKRSANNVMWTLFVVVFCLIHTLQRFLIASGSEWIKFKKKYECCWKQRSIIKANLHLLYLSVCTRLLVLYVVWMTVQCVRWKYVWELVITAEEFPPCDSFQFSILLLLILFFLFFLFACQKYILMLIVTSL